MTSFKILTNQICLFPSYKWVICSLFDRIKHIKNCKVAQDLNPKATPDATPLRRSARLALLFARDLFR